MGILERIGYGIAGLFTLLGLGLLVQAIWTQDERFAWLAAVAGVLAFATFMAAIKPACDRSDERERIKRRQYHEWLEENCRYVTEAAVSSFGIGFGNVGVWRHNRTGAIYYED